MTHKLRKSRHLNIELPEDDLFDKNKASTSTSNQPKKQQDDAKVHPKARDAHSTGLSSKNANPQTNVQSIVTGLNSINSISPSQQDSEQITSSRAINYTDHSSHETNKDSDKQILNVEEPNVTPVFRNKKRKRSLNVSARAELFAEQTVNRKKVRIESTRREINAKCNNIITKLIELKDKDAPLVAEFLNPVNPRYAQGYYQVVDRPICLSDMLKKSEQHDYDTFDDLRVDIEIMLQNELKYQNYMKSNKLTDTMKRIQRVAETLLNIHARKPLPINVPFSDLDNIPTAFPSRSKASVSHRRNIVPYGKIQLTFSDFDSIRELIKKGVYIYSTDVLFREDLKKLFYKQPPIVPSSDGYINSCRPSKEVGLKHLLMDMEKQNQKKHQGIIQTHYQFKGKGKVSSKVKLSNFENISVFKNDKNRFREWKCKSVELNLEGEKLVLEYQKLFPHWYFMQRFSLRSIILTGLGCLYDLANTYWIRMMKQILTDMKSSETAYFSIVAGYDSKIQISNLFKDLLHRLSQDAQQSIERPKSLSGQAERIVYLLDWLNGQWVERHLPTHMRNLSLAKAWSRFGEPESALYSRTTLYIMIHSADSLTLRDEDFQKALTILMNSPHISCLLTYNSIYSRLLYDLHMSSSGKPYFCDCTTLRPFEVGEDEIQSKTQSQSDSFEIFKTNLRGMTRNVQDFMKLFVLKLNQFENGATINELVDFCREEQTLHTWVGDYSKLENILLEPVENKMLRKKGNRYYLNVSTIVAEKLQAHFRSV